MATTTTSATSAERVYEFTSTSSMVGAVNDFLGTLPPGRRIQACQLVTSCCEALVTEAAAEFVASDGDTRAAERALSNRKTSKRATRRAAKRAAAVAKNPTIADRMKSQELSGEQVDEVIRADRRTGGAASDDNELLDELAKASADRTGRIIDKFIVDQAAADSVQKEHDRQRKLRDVRKHRTALGLSALTIAGDDATIDAMHKQLMSDANRLYKLDGGREVRNSEHSRTHGQRLFDAAHARITGKAKSKTANTGTIKSARVAEAPAARRPTVVVTVPADKLTGANPSLVAEQIGVGPIADSVLAAYLGDSQIGVDLLGALFGFNGEPLWLGRKARYASGAQHLALIIRDKGCVECGASADRCQVHHRIPWNSPAKGETNLDDLVLMCSSCHHRLHEEKQTLYRHHTTGRWRKRPATPDEIAPSRPERRQAPTPTGDRRESSTPQPQNQPPNRDDSAGPVQRGKAA